MKISVLLLPLIFLSAFEFAPVDKKEAAKNILVNSLKEAKISNKAVFLIFHASWCKWCKRLDASLESNELKKIIEDNFVIAHIDVLEQEEKKSELENPGGDSIMVHLGGKDSGLPFYVFLKSNGKKIADSNVMPKNQNIGYPGSNTEIAAFSKLLKKSARHLSNHQLEIIKDYFKKNAPMQ